MNDEQREIDLRAAHSPACEGANLEGDALKELDGGHRTRRHRRGALRSTHGSEHADDWDFARGLTPRHGRAASSASKIEASSNSANEGKTPDDLKEIVRPKAILESVPRRREDRDRARSSFGQFERFATSCSSTLRRRLEGPPATIWTRVRAGGSGCAAYAPEGPEDSSTRSEAFAALRRS